MIKNIIFLYLFFISNCEKWFDEVNGFDIADYNYGYAGSSNNPMTDFYLCGERFYRVHYMEENTWSDEFSACQPVGNGTIIDGISIIGENLYLGRWKGDSEWYWPETNNNITYVGSFGKYLNGIAIDREDIYRSAYKIDNSSNEKKVAERVTSNLFGKNETYNYDNEINVYKNNDTNVTVQLFNASKINYNGNLNIKIEDNKIKYSDWNELIDQKLNDYLKEIINFDIKQIISLFEKGLYEAIKDGNIAINFNWTNKTIEIDVASKIQNDHYSFRGGFRIKININNIELIIIEKVLKFFAYNYGSNIFNLVREKLSNLNTTNFEFGEIDNIINEFGINAKTIDIVIFLIILNPILKKS